MNVVTLLRIYIAYLPAIRTIYITGNICDAQEVIKQNKTLFRDKRFTKKTWLSN